MAYRPGMGTQPAVLTSMKTTSAPCCTCFSTASAPSHANHCVAWPQRFSSAAATWRLRAMSSTIMHRTEDNTAAAAAGRDARGGDVAVAAAAATRATGARERLLLSAPAAAGGRGTSGGWAALPMAASAACAFESRAGGAKNSPVLVPKVASSSSGCASFIGGRRGDGSACAEPAAAGEPVWVRAVAEGTPGGGGGRADAGSPRASLTARQTLAVLAGFMTTSCGKER